MTVKLLEVSKLNRRLHRLRVYSCQTATLLEMSKLIFFILVPLHVMVEVLKLLLDSDMYRLYIAVIL